MAETTEERAEITLRPDQMAKLAKTIDFIGAFYDALTPEMISRLLTLIMQWGELADRVMQSQLGRALPEMIADADAILSRPIETDAPVTLRRLWRELRDPDVARGLEIAVAFLRRAGQMAPRSPENE